MKAKERKKRAGKFRQEASMTQLKAMTLERGGDASNNIKRTRRSEEKRK